MRRAIFCFLLLLTACDGGDGTDAGAPSDAGADSGSSDSGLLDDAGVDLDAGMLDAGMLDAGMADAGSACVAMGAGFDKRWTGLAGASWSEAGSWDPAGVPTASDTVFVCTDAATAPVLDANAVALDVFVAAGATLDTDTRTLTLGGDVAAPGEIVGTGEVVLQGDGASIDGTIAAVLLEAEVVAGPALDVTGSLRIRSGGGLDLDGQTVTVQDLDERFGPGVSLDDPADRLVIRGDWFASPSGRALTDGVVELRGDLEGGGNNSVLVSEGTRVELRGTATQDLAFRFSGPTSNRFDELVVANPVGVTIDTGMHARLVTIEAGAGPITGAAPEEVSIDDGLVGDGAAWQVAETTITGGAPSLPAEIGSLRFTFRGDVTIPGDLRVLGDLYAEVTTQRLVLDGHTLEVDGDMVVRFGTVVLTQPTDRLVVRGDLTHATSASVGELTDGLVELGGDITLGGGNQSFVSTGTRVEANGAAPQDVEFIFTGPTSNRFDDLDVVSGSELRFVTSSRVEGDLSVNGRVLVDAGRALTVVGQLVLGPGAVLENLGTMSVGSCVRDPSATILGSDPCP